MTGSSSRLLARFAHSSISRPALPTAFAAFAMLAMGACGNEVPNTTAAPPGESYEGHEEPSSEGDPKAPRDPADSGADVGVPSTPTPTPCTVEVPRDYPGLGQAVAALLNTGGKICLRAPPTDGSKPHVTSVPSGTPPLEIEGYGREAPHDNSRIVVEGYTAGLRISNIALQRIDITDAIVEIRGSRVVGMGGTGVSVLQTNYGSIAKVLIEGSDISGVGHVPQGVQGGVLVQSSGNAPGGELLRVQNSYIHDSNPGVMYRDHRLSRSGGDVFLVNNTIANNVVGIQFSLNKETTGGSVARYANNVFYANEDAVWLNLAASDPRLSPTNNGFYANTRNFHGPVPPGPGYLTTDPLFDLTKLPPAPAASSPYAGKGDPSFPSAVDFHGRARPTPPTLGAVEP